MVEVVFGLFWVTGFGEVEETVNWLYCRTCMQNSIIHPFLSSSVSKKGRKRWKQLDSVVWALICLPEIGSQF